MGYWQPGLRHVHRGNTQVRGRGEKAEGRERHAGEEEVPTLSTTAGEALASLPHEAATLWVCGAPWLCPPWEPCAAFRLDSFSRRKSSKEVKRASRTS